jgi:hypothetical protein
MFDGTDLSLAYGNSFEPPSNSNYQNMQQPPDPTNMKIPKSTSSHEMPPDPPYVPPPAMYAQQSPKAPSSVREPPSDSFWDRVAGKKWEVFKLFVMALIILLAISLDHLATHYLVKYIQGSFLTENQELIVRAGYPVAILLFIWILKASA